jgi:N-acetylglutamate synthase-like GNAT family acetyltransferase
MIRQFHAEDAPACSGIIRACLVTDPQMPASLRDGLLRSETEEAMVQRAASFYVAVHESEEGILGVGGLDLNEVRLLYVCPPHQGRGVGSALLSHLESMVPAALFADIFVYSTFASVDFYRARGFSARGEYAFEFGPNQLTTVFMTKPIR